MTKNTLGRSGSAAVCAVLLAIATALSACSVAPTACAGTTDAPIYLMDNTTATQIAAGARLDGNTSDGVVLATHAVRGDVGDLVWAPFAPVPGASSVVAVLAAPGSERTPKAWKQWDDVSSIDTDGSGIWTFTNPAVCAGAPVAQATASLVVDRVAAGSVRAAASTRPNTW
jgi:hypothetical protein